MSRTPGGEDDVVVSGLGVLSAAGASPAELHAALCRATPLWTVPGPSQRTGAEFPIASAPLHGFEARDYVDRRGLKDLSRVSQLACAGASRLGTLLDGTRPGEVGVALGSAWASQESILAFEWETCTQPARLVDPLLFAETVPNVPAGQMSIQFGWSAFNLTLSSGTASGLAAVGEAVVRIAAGGSLVAVAGGADALNAPLLRTLHARGHGIDAAARPFGRTGGGPIGGEGAGFLMLESGDRARARGRRPVARLLATISGFAAPRHAGRPDDSGPGAAAIEALLRELLDGAALAPGEVQLVVASAGGASAGDREEALAIHRLFGEGPAAPWVMAPKGILGETWGASGPLAACAAIEAMRTSSIPGRPRGTDPNPKLPPINLPPEAVSAKVRHAVVIAVADTGHLAALLLATPAGE